MAWELLDTTRDMLTGDYSASVSASAWLAGEVTVPDLEVTAADWTSALDGQTVRSTLTLTVDDDEGRLVPYQGGDPLAPYGAQISAASIISAGGDSDSIPLGRYLIASASPSGSWVPYLGRYLPTGGTITLQTQDILQDLIESEIPGLMQPGSDPAQVAYEARRLCRDICPVDTDGIPAGLTVSRKGAVYDQVRLTAILSLLPPSVLIRAGRGGVAEFFELPTLVSKVVTPAAGEWVSASMDLDRDGLVNTVITTSDQADSRISGLAQETAGPFSASGPLKPRIYRHSSPLYTTSAQAMAGAATRLASLLAERSLPVTVTMPFDPSVDAGDLHRVALVPGSLEPVARVKSIRWTLGSAEMAATYSVSREEVQSWMRPSDLQRS